MNGPTGGAPRRLRAVPEGTPASRRGPQTPEALADAILACLDAAPGGLAPRALAPALAERLGVPADRLPGREVEVALGLLIATGRVDEAGGRLARVPEEGRRAG